MVVVKSTHPINNPDGLTPNCAGTDLEVWFPGDTVHNTSSEIQAARRVCNACPLLEPCRDWGLRHEMFGIYGGLSAGERRVIRIKAGISYSAPEVAILGRAG